MRISLCPDFKDKDEWKGIYFNDDLTEQQANEQCDLRALAAYAKNKSFNSYVKDGNLWLDGRGYRYEEIHRLPHEISFQSKEHSHPRGQSDSISEPTLATLELISMQPHL